MKPYINLSEIESGTISTDILVKPEKVKAVYVRPGNKKKRDYKKEYINYHCNPEQKKNRAKRNAARKIMGVKVGDKREVDHMMPLSKGGTNDKSNLRVVSRKTNRKKGNR